MITGVTLNPCNDLTVNIPSFVYGGMNRIQSERLDIAGKGYNVARAVSRLGEAAAATGFLYNDNGAATQALMEQDGVTVDCVWEPGRIRTNMKLFDMEQRVVTEVNQAGVFATPESLERVLRKTEQWAKQSDFISFSGSLPPGCPEDFYVTLIAAAQRANPRCRTVLDAEGKKLTAGIAARPFLIKPNRFELETAVGRELPDLNDLVSASREIISQGVSVVAVSLGGDGAFVADARESFFAPRVDVVVRGTVAAGDCMVAGLCVGFLRSLPLREVFRLGVASATACVMQEGTGLVTRELLQEVLPKVAIRSV